MTAPGTPSMTPQQLTTSLRNLGIADDYGRRHKLRKRREPTRLESIGLDHWQREQWLRPPAARALLQMLAQAHDDGIDIHTISAFRTIAYQCEIIERKLARDQDIDDILKTSAAPGYSEHHTGRAVDLGSPGYASLEEDFENSPAFTWLQNHAHAYGFQLSYPRGNRHGIGYEPWHWCWHRAKR